MEYIKVAKGSQLYPKKLYDLLKPPKEIYCSGNMKLLENRLIAIVGSRKTSPYGQWVATKLGEIISGGGGTVISGMATGIDTFGHRGALSNVGSTIAVMGTGIDLCYPKHNWSLKEKILREGLVITEYPPGQSAEKWTFPQRNRIIAALSDLVVVVEAGLNSGAIITADLGIQLNKDVIAIPSNINSVYGIGTNKLILDGAIPLITLGEILEYGKLNKSDLSRQEAVNLSKEEKAIYEIILSTSEITAGEISKALKLDIRKVSVLVTMLELKGLVQTAVGRIFIKK